MEFRFLVTTTICVVGCTSLHSATLGQERNGSALNARLTHSGNPLGLNANIANQPITSKEYGIPFVARASGRAKNILWWARNSGNTDSGYSKGSGGEIRITIHEDDSGVPSEIYLGNPFFEKFELDDDNNTHEQYRQTDLASTGVFVEEGHKYWIVFKNVHPDRGHNFLSLNGPILVNHADQYGKWETERIDPHGARAFHIARPCDNFYLHQRQRHEGDEPNKEPWVPYRENNMPSHIAVPFVILRVDGEESGIIDHGFPFTYGPIWTGYPGPDWLERMPKVSGLNRIRQLATFEDCDTFPIENPQLKFFARSFDMDKTTEVALLVNGVYQGCVDVSELNWYSVPLDISIEANQRYEIEFLAGANAEAMIMGSPMVGTTALGYRGNAQLSTNGGQDWVGYQVGHHQNHQGVQLSFYIEGSVPAE